MAPRPRKSDSLLIDIYQSLGELQGDVKQLMAGQVSAHVERQETNTRLQTMSTDFAIVNREVARLTPIVNLLEKKSNAGEGAWGVGSAIGHVVSGSVGGAIAAAATWFSHK